MRVGNVRMAHILLTPRDDEQVPADGDSAADVADGCLLMEVGPLTAAGETRVMLTAGSSFTGLGCTVDADVAVAQGMLVERLVRTRLVVDARYIGPLHRSPRAANLWLVVEGESIHNGVRTTAPSVWCVEEQDSLQVGGARSVVVELRVDRTCLGDSLRGAKGALPLPPSIAPMVHAWDDTMAARLVQALVDAELLVPTLAGAVTAPIPETTRRLWSALAQAYTSQHMMIDHVQLATDARFSMRTLQRELHRFHAWAHLDTSFRAMVRGMRIRRAALLLSAPQATITAVAKVVGYGSPDALARAFRVAELPSPGAVRHSVTAWK